MQTPPISDDTRHVLAYLPWRTILAWRKEEAQAGRRNGRRLNPYVYASRVSKAHTHLREGDLLWIFTIPYFGKYGSLPSLYALLVVEDNIDQAGERNKKRLGRVPSYLNAEGHQQYRYVFTGNRELSCYFPLNDFSDQLQLLLSPKAARRLEQGSPNGYGFLGMAFQQPRIIEAALGKQFYAYQQQLHRRRVLFISCRHREAPETVRLLVEGLLKTGINCRLGLDRTVGRLSKDAALLFKTELLLAIEQSDSLLALESEAYWQSFWTGLEYGAAQALAEVKPGFHFFDAYLPALEAEKERRALIEEASRWAG